MSTEYYLSGGCGDAYQVPAMRTYYGGRGVGTVVVEEGDGIPPETILVSEYGEILTAAAVRAMSGHGRNATTVRDIGELCGYPREVKAP